MLGRIKNSTFPDTSVSSYTYNGLEVTFTNREQQASTQIRNAAGWVTQSLDNLQTPVDFTYYPFGELHTTQVDNNSDTTVTVYYDGLGRRTRITDPNAGTHWWFYNALGHVSLEINANGQMIVHDYDQQNREIRRQDDFTYLNLTQTWTYDQQFKGALDSVVGKLTNTTSYSESYQYNAYGQPTQITYDVYGQVLSGTITYDDYSRPLENRFANHSTATIYNEFGFAQKIADTSTGQVVWKANSTNNTGQITNIIFGDGSQTTNTFDPNTGLISDINATKGGQTLVNHHYEFDHIGKLESREDYKYGVTQSFCYDDLNRMVASRFNGCSSSDADYIYDDLGNIKYKEGVGNYTYGEGSAGPNAVTNANGLNYTYDSAGNLIEARDANGQVVISASYSVNGKPIGITKNNYNSEIAYAPSGRRALRIDNNNDIRYSWYAPGFGEMNYLGFLGVATINHKINDQVSFIFEVGNPSQGYYEYYHKDHLGSVVARTTDKPGDSGQFESFDPWGVRLLDAWDGVPIDRTYGYTNVNVSGFTGHEHLDTVGIVHMNGRVYDPEIGRFLSPDPLVQAPYNTQSYNRYSYVFNNPLSYTDPTGYQSQGANQNDYEEIPVYAPSRDQQEIDRRNQAFKDNNTATLMSFQIQTQSQNGYFSMIAVGDRMFAGLSFDGGDSWSIAEVEFVESEAGDDWSESEEEPWSKLLDPANWPTLPNGVVNTAAGFGDGVSFGLTNVVRGWMGTNDVVDLSSPEYALSSVAGQITTSTILVGGVVLRPFTAQSQVVTQWTTAGQLGANTRWVMTGGNSYRNYIMAGGPQLQASYTQSVTATVSGSSLRWPSGMEWFKGFFGQRILK